uniref:Uncharacterized protein n=1 Tax=Eptatretus burgeri TaxID=7764 RepID=A0A8C4NHE9_EPTBU
MDSHTHICLLKSILICLEISLFVLLFRCQNTSISLSQFDNYYCDLEANSELGFSEQFANLQDVGRYEMISVARLPESREKNRYTNILPCKFKYYTTNHSRVILKTTSTMEVVKQKH